MQVSQTNYSVRMRAIVSTAVLVLLLTALLASTIALYPTIQDPEVQRPDGWHTVALPLIDLFPPRLTEHFRFTLNVPLRHVAGTFSLRYHDSLSYLRVNGMQITGAFSGSFVNLENVLHTGDNFVEVAVRASSQPPTIIFSMAPSITTPLIALSVILFLVLVCQWLVYLRRIGSLSTSMPVFCILLVGVLLRCLYAFATPYFLRSYDSGGHLQYVAYTVIRWTLPSFSDHLWQGHQPPLFYVLAAPFAALGRSAGWDVLKIALLVQLLPILLSIGTLLVGARIIRRHVESPVSRIVATLLLVSFPWLVYLSSQISNDALLTFVGFLWFERLLIAVKEGGRRSWFMTAVFCGIGLVTKANALPWLVVSACMALLASVPVRRRMEHLLLIAVTSFVTGGFWYVWQAVRWSGFSVVANAFDQAATTPLPLSIADFFVFDPLSMIRSPTVGISALAGRPLYFFETLFRTAQLGSFAFSHDVNILLLLSLFLLPCLVLGCIDDCRRRGAANSLTIAILLLAAALFRLRYPFATALHFRYVAVATVPLVLLVTRGIALLRPAVVRMFLEATVALYALFVAIIVLSVVLVA